MVRTFKIYSLRKSLLYAIELITMKVLVVQSCLTLCNPMDCSPPGSSIHGIFQARILEWVAMPSPGGLPDPGIEPRSTVVIMFYIRSSDPVHLGTETCTLFTNLTLFPHIYPTHGNPFSTLFFYEFDFLCRFCE